MSNTAYDLPAIVIPVYKRPQALSRLIDSLKKADYPSGNVKLIISVEGNATPSVKQLAEHVYWPYGQKAITYQESQQGLEQHLLQCGSFSIELNKPVIVFEDDLFASPYFYHWALKAIELSYHDENVGGLSLYSFSRTFPFSRPFQQASLTEACYIQKVSTWGQIFTPNQWQQFEDWRLNEPDLLAIDKGLPPPVQSYPDDNWEKLYNRYLIDTKKYFLYPPNSFSTNFGDLGVHVKRKNEENAFQVPLQMDSQLPEISKIEETTAVYDAFFELLPSRMKGLNPILKPYDFEVDLYGTKPFEEIEKPYVLSCKKALNPEMTFGRNLKPHELNIAYEIEGRDFFLAKRENFQENLIDKWRRELRTHYYHYPDVGITKTLKMKIFEIINRFL